MNCWWCGTEPVEVFDICSMESATPVRQEVVWPDGDHPHSERPPSADDLADEAYRLLTGRSR